MDNQFYNKTRDFTLKVLKVDEHKGLSGGEVKKRQAEFGANEFTKPKQASLLQELGEMLTEQLIVILLIAAGISFLIREYSDAVGICIAVLVGCVIGLVTESRSKKSAEALAKMAEDIEVKVLRDGNKVTINKSELVPGDIVYLESGDMVPADGRLLEAMDLKLREDMLTGESDDVRKHETIVEPEKVVVEGQAVWQDPVPAKQKNMLFGGTLVAYGHGKMVVTSIGDGTEMGSIAKELGEREEDTPLQIKMGRLGEMISKVSTAIATMLFVYMLIQIVQASQLSFDFSSIGGFFQSLKPLGAHFPEIKTAFVVCVALIVAAVPEGLPTMINMTLAITMQQMAKINVLVRKKEACETIGAISVICSDKTGTLTQNKMRVGKVYIGGNYMTDTRILQNETFLNNCMINSTADIEHRPEGEKYVGSATECALLRMLDGQDYRTAREQAAIVRQVPFTSQNKYMLTILGRPGGYEVLSKGAPEVVIGQCGYEQVGKEVRPLTAARKEALKKEIEAMQDLAMRVLAFAHLETADQRLVNQEMEWKNRLVFTGFVGIHDPLRPGVKEAISEAKEAGIETKILTGDNIHTAIAIGKELGLMKDGKQAVEATYIDTLSDEKLRKELPKISIVARSKPTTKMRIVQALQADGEIVAVTGDGINDAPALTKADVGIAMGIAGTEVSKNAADIILTDDSFTTIVQAVKWGRGIYNNFQRFIQFQLTVNIIAFVIAIISQVLGHDMPFTTIHLLWINIIMDGPPALALGLEPVREAVMRRKPISRDKNIINHFMVRTIIINSTYIIALLYAQIKWDFLGVGVNSTTANGTEVQTVLFSLFAFSVLFNAFNCREFGTTSILPNFLKNKLAILIIICTGIAQIMMTQFCGSFFNAVPLSMNMWVRILLAGSSIVVVNEIVKVALRLGKRSAKQAVKTAYSFRKA